MFCTKWTHPRLTGALYTPPHEQATPAQILEDYIGDLAEPGDIDRFTREEVEMTEEEFDALPEFEG